ncbi:hypothetical protein [Halobacteriovorax marinus]|uniref:hypothetical protein n=1 Tax=Halobacteriovorax marinus TaxID=97084 RepID=UPI003A91B0A4
MMKYLLLLSFALLFSCGKSPLLNHETERNQSTQNQSALLSKLNLKNSELILSIQWIKGPFSDASLENSFMIIVQDRNGNLSDIPNESEFYIWGWMPSMGHGTADDGYTERLSKGIYLQREFYFNMGGDWEINLELYKNNQSIDATKIRLDL